MMPPFKMGIGTHIGTEMQYMPWVYIDDLMNIFVKSIEEGTMRESYNTVSFEQTTNEEFSILLARIMDKPFFMPNVPPFLLKMILGE